MHLFTFRNFVHKVNIAKMLKLQLVLKSEAIFYHFETYVHIFCFVLCEQKLDIKIHASYKRYNFHNWHFENCQYFL